VNRPKTEIIAKTKLEGDPKDTVVKEGEKLAYRRDMCGVEGGGKKRGRGE